MILQQSGNTNNGVLKLCCTRLFKKIIKDDSSANSLCDLEQIPQHLRFGFCISK